MSQMFTNHSVSAAFVFKSELISLRVLKVLDEPLCNSDTEMEGRVRTLYISKECKG